MSYDQEKIINSIYNRLLKYKKLDENIKLNRKDIEELFYFLIKNN